LTTFIGNYSSSEEDPVSGTPSNSSSYSSNGSSSESDSSDEEEGSHGLRRNGIARKLIKKVAPKVEAKPNGR
jgi:hypothetical protein